MTLLTTAPQRLAMMALDASDELIYATDEFRETLDSSLRPGVLVEIGDGEYAGDASGARAGTETYTLSIIGNKRGQGGVGDEEERRTRQIVNDIVLYFLKHTQCQMSNDRGKQAQAYPPLSWVKWMTVRRGGVNPSAKGNEEDFWGCQLTVTLEIDVMALERLVAR